MAPVRQHIRHCERSEAIHSAAGEMDCFVAPLLAMTGRISSPHYRSGALMSVTSSPVMCRIRRTIDDIVGAVDRAKAPPHPED
jgi:hypothetical protein